MPASLRYNGALALLLLSSGLMGLVDAASGNNKFNHAKAEFMQSMKEASIQKDKAQRKRKLYESIVNQAVPVDKSSSLRRKLEDGAYYNDADDNANADADEYGDYGFDVSSYSLKYAGCSAIATFSDAMAQADDAVESVFSSMNYVVFRLCPTDECSDSHSYGCAYDYGEYMLPMGTWLEIMAEYREEEFERYCEFCADCMALEENRRLDDAAAADDQAAAAADDQADADAAAEEEAEEVEEEHACQYYNACSIYADVCNERRRLDDGYSDVADFFECTKVEGNDGNHYVGPHCSNDKNTIVIGMFKDQYCTEYIGQNGMYESTGLNFANNAMAYLYKDDCIACKESNLPYQQVEEDAEDDNEVTQMCENLYSASAKCNSHIGGATSQSYTSDEQNDNSQATCSYISSVVTGHYDEQGFIYSSSREYRKDNQNNKYHITSEKYSVVTVGQVFGLIFFSVAFLGMWVWSCFLRDAVTKKAPWTGPNKDDNAALAAHISRQNSGIGAARSKSFGAMA